MIFRFMIPEKAWSTELSVTLQAQCLPNDNGCDLMLWVARVFKMAKGIIWPREPTLATSNDTGLRVCILKRITVGYAPLCF